jgi:YggT family protein
MATNLAVVLLNFTSYVIGLYQMVIIAAVIFSWLIGFNVINPSNDFVRALWQGLNAVTEPLLKPIRRALPDMGGLDISPIILILACVLIQQIIGQVLIPAALGA